MKFNSTYIVKMARERENALFCLVVPDFDFVVITTTYEHRLRLVEVNTPHGS